MKKTKNKKIYFYNSEIELCPKIFRPRPETEQLVDLSQNYIHSWFEKRKIDVLEIGTGSGVIAISWKKIFPHHQIFVSEIDEKALKCAKKNFLRHKLKIKSFFCDLFPHIPQKYHFIIANLPYIAYDHPLSKNVKQNDSPMSLYGGVTGCEIFDKFLKKVKLYLKKNFLISLEIGYNQKETLTKMIKKYLPQANFIFQKDYGGLNRFCFIYQKE